MVSAPSEVKAAGYCHDPVISFKPGHQEPWKGLGGTSIGLRMSVTAYRGLSDAVRVRFAVASIISSNAPLI